jgi:2-oxoglutarate dehydrogenase E1 component
MHISDPEAEGWMQERIEGPDKEISFTRGQEGDPQQADRGRRLREVLDVKYTGTKRFGLDGGEALIPALEQIIKRGGALGVKDIVLGMAHRGRLNVLTQVMGKPHRAMFHEFKGGSSRARRRRRLGRREVPPRRLVGPRVRRQQGASVADRQPVASRDRRSGGARQGARQAGPASAAATDRRCAARQVLPLLMHGDAAFAGQGVVAECLGLSGLKGHRTGGSIHFIINNQIGFTTNPRYSRSSPYPSDVAKMIEAPIFHVNGDDPEAVVFAAKVATEFRQKFHKPVVIDMFCYRRFGHNEGDEPASPSR